MADRVAAMYPAIGPDPGHCDRGPGRSAGSSSVDATGLCGVGLGSGEEGGALASGEVQAASASVIASAAVTLFTDGAV